MTDRKGNEVGFQKWILDRLITKAADWAIIGFLGLVAVLLFQPLQSRLAAIWNTPVAMIQFSETMDRLARDVRRLQQPRRVFEVSPNTGPVGGSCTEGEPCTIRLRLRRLLEALDCQIVPGSVEWGFINPRSDSFVHAERLDKPAGRNIGPNWEDTFIRIITPIGLKPTASFTFIAQYTDCPGWEEGEPPLEYQNEPIPFVIRQGG